jgi:uncharacterized protein (TIGR03067 family)
MRVFGLACLAAVLTVSVCPADTASSLPTELVGKWNVVHRAYTSGTTAGAIGDSLTQYGNLFQFSSNGQITSLDAQGNGLTLNVTADSTQTPKTFDVTVPGTSWTFPGIYKIDASTNTLTICTGADGTRPTSFDSTGNLLLFVLKPASN